MDGLDITSADFTFFVCLGMLEYQSHDVLDGFLSRQTLFWSESISYMLYLLCTAELTCDLIY